MTLTIQQRAKRRTTKINNRVTKALPLFAGTSAIDTFLTNEATQLEAVKRWDEIAERYVKRLEDGDKEWIEKAAVYRNQLAKLISRDDLKEYDELLAYKIDRWSAYKNNPVYIADYWHCILRAVNP